MLRALCVLGLVSCFALPARAWTRAQVRDAVAEVTPRADGQLEVRLDLGLVVQGGWLERLELPGLDEGLTLAAEPTLSEVEEGIPYPAPSASAEADSLVVSFEKKHAPRRGVYRLVVSYTAPLAQRLDEGTFRWTLPGFQAGLDRAEILLRLPAGARALPDPELAYEVHAEPQAQAVHLRFVRVNVPRSVPWSVGAELARAQAPTSNAAPRGRSLFAFTWPRFDAYAWAVLLVFGVSWGARERLRRVARREGLTTRSLWTSPRWAFGAACGFALAALALHERTLGGSLAALCGVGLAFVERVGAPRSAPGFGHFVPVDTRALASLARPLRGSAIGREIRSYRALRWGVLGAAALGVLLGAGAFGGQGHAWALALACLAVPWASASSDRHPRSTAERLQCLVQAASTLRLSGCALRLVWFVRAGQAPTDPRLRITPSVPFPGVLRIEVLTHPAREHAPLVLSVVVAPGSVAEAALRERWTEAVCEPSQGGQRVAFMAPVAALEDALSTLFSTFSSHNQRVLEERIRAARKAA